MGRYHVTSDTIHHGPTYDVYVSAVPAGGERSSLGVVVRIVNVATLAEAAAASLQLVAEVRALVLARGDILAEG
jgi:hypothetical protein